MTIIRMLLRGQNSQCRRPETDVKNPKLTSEGKGSDKGVKMTSFYAWEGETLILNILGKPSAKQDAIGKAKGNQLKVSVTAAPVAGKATDHMVRFLAPQFGVSISDITVVFGRYNINKQLRIQSPQQLPPVIAKALSK